MAQTPSSPNTKWRGKRQLPRPFTLCQLLHLRLEIKLPLKRPDTRCCQAHRQSPILCSFGSTPEVRALCSAGITRPRRSYDPVRRPPGLPASPGIRSRDLRPKRASPDHPQHLCQRAVPSTPADRDGCICRLLPHLTRPSPYYGRVGIRYSTFEACSGFTHVTARWLAQPPKAAFVAGLRPARLPGQTACQLPVQPTTHCVATSSTGVTRARGALRNPG